MAEPVPDNSRSMDRDLLLEWLRQPSWHDRRTFLEQHPHLLDDETSDMLRQFAEDARERGEERVASWLGGQLELLAMVRREGIGYVFGMLEYSALAEQLKGEPEAHQISMYEQALTLLPRTRHPVEWAHLQANLGNAYTRRRAGNGVADLKRAISCFRAALEILPAPLRGSDRTDGHSLWLCTQMDLAFTLIDLGRLVSGADSIAAHIEAIACEKSARAVVPDAPREVRIQLAAEWLGTHFFTERNWLEAVRYLSEALDGFDEMYSSYTGGGREWGAERVAALPAQLAYAHVSAGTPDAALSAARALERGRGRGQSLALNRQEVLSRAETYLPSNFVAQLRDAGARVDLAELPDVMPNTQASYDRRVATGELSGSGLLHVEYRRFVAWREAFDKYERVLAEISTSFPEFRGSLREERDPITAGGSLLEPAEGIVYIGHTALGAVAVLLTRQPSGPAVVGHAWCDETFTTGAIQAVLERSVRTSSGETLTGLLPAHQRYEDLERAVNAAIESLGAQDGVIARVADRCREAGLQRIVIVPCGLWGLLPLHAAPVSVDDKTPTMPLLDVVQVGFAHSARTWSLSRTRARRLASYTPSALVIGNPIPAPPGEPPLDGAEAEIGVVSTLASSLFSGHVVTLEGISATRANVLASLDTLEPSPTHLHLACHAFADLAQPQQSGVLLAGGEVLTVRDLLERMGHATSLRLAVLSACQTAVIGPDVPDEVMGLPSAFLQIGGATVVASLWSVSDTSTLALMRKFYELHFIDHLEPCEALWLAQRWLRGLPSWSHHSARTGTAGPGGGQGPDEPCRTGDACGVDDIPGSRWDGALDWAAFVAYGD